MKMIAGAFAASALLLLVPAAVEANGNKGKSYSSYSGGVPHQKTGGNHPGGHSSTTGHKNSGKGVAYYTSGGGHVHNGCHGHPVKTVARCFPPGHCKSITQGYYGPPGQR